MAKTPATHRYREDLSEVPDWMKKKKCPNRDKYLSGKRILPKNLTGTEKLADVVDNDIRLGRKIRASARQSIGMRGAGAIGCG